jgi:CRISPR-associated protein Cmr2
MKRRVLHFTLGPVQDFIEQARRTRDFWAGSFILSLLSGHAMRALKDKNGEIVFPQIEDDPLFEALSGNGREPHVGSLPNRFKADIDKVQGDAGKICKDTVEVAWKEICASVWTLLFEATNLAPEVQQRKAVCREIWDRQINSFWDMAWVEGPEPDDGSDGSWLDIRKNFRSHLPKQEGGDLCRLMGQYQEISGFDRINDREKQQKFWAALSKGRELDLRPDERLCAIALVKRFFPVAAEKAGGIAGAMPWVPGGSSVKTRYWPSTSYIAALPWLERVAKLGKGSLMALPDAASAHLKVDFKGEKRTALYGLPDDSLFDLDGQLLHRDGILTAAKEWFPDDEPKREAAAIALDGALVSLATEVGRAKSGAANKKVYASEFYAVLRMDGDGIGKLIGEKSYVAGIAVALADFASKVSAYFSSQGNDRNKSLGALIYAGGDDVLALLPVDTAVEAACHIEDLYRQAFASQFEVDVLPKFSISAAVIYTHFKNPLSAALRQSALLLDDIAKEKNGRSSLALAVMKPGGLAAQWVSTFDASVVELEALAKDSWGTRQDEGLSAGFFHGLQQSFSPLFQNSEGGVADFSSADLLESLVKAEMLRQFGGNRADEDILKQVMAILRPTKRDGDGVREQAEGVAFGGGLVVRFLRNERRREKP